MLVTPTTAEGVQTSGNVESGANVAQQAHMVAMFTILGTLSIYMPWPAFSKIQYSLIVI